MNSKKILSLMVATIVVFVNVSTFAAYDFEKGAFDKQCIGTVAEHMPRFETNIGPGSLVADAMLALTGNCGAQVALISGFEVRNDLAVGPVTKSDIKRLVVNSPLITIDLSVADLTKLIELIASKKQRPNTDIAGIHVSGVRFNYNKKGVAGNKIGNLEIGSLANGYTSGDPSAIVRVVTTVYSLNDLIVLKGRRCLWDVNFEYVNLCQAIEQYIASLKKPIVNCPENRINDVDTRIMVFSDPHYFNPSLLISNGQAFQMYLAQDRKLIAESQAILLSTVSMIRNAHPDICLVPGDLTKDGELLSHVNFNQIITDSLLSAGIKVYVSPGNHDINNNEAMSYNGSIALPVENVSDEKFTSIYDDLGYGDAIARDSASLTYIVEPENGLWVLSLDACKYDSNEAHSHTGGALSDGTLAWVLEKLDFAKRHNITVVGMMHHGVTEHYTGQTQIMMGLFNDYVIDNWTALRSTLAAHGLNVVFTGHYHAQDIVKHTTTDGKFIFDIETGSTVTWPCPVRTVGLSADRVLDVTTSNITQIDYPLPVLSFQEYARSYLIEGLNGLVYYILAAQFGVPDQQARMLSPLVSSAMSAHYAGDEKPGFVDIATYTQLKMSPDYLTASMGLALESLWTDLLPSDNNCTINLIDGITK